MSSFDDIGRLIDSKIEVYFDGLSATPVTLNKSDYLVSWNITEELGADDYSPIGVPSANILDLVLLNTENIFTPNSGLSIYKDKIGKNVPIKAFIKLKTDVDWIPMGTYYTTDWYASVGSLEANITAYDYMYTILNMDMPFLPVRRGVLFKDYITLILVTLGISASDIIIHESLQTIKLPYAFVKSGKVKTTITPLMTSMLAHIWINREGKVEIAHLDDIVTTPLTWTDSVQIVDIATKQSALRQYETVSLIYSTYVSKSDVDLVSATSQTLHPGDTEFTLTTTSGPVLGLQSINAIPQTYITPTGLYSDAWTIKVRLANSSAIPVEATMKITGAVLSATEYTIIAGDAAATDNVLKVEVPYLQTNTEALALANRVQAFTAMTLNILEVNVRGNPLVNLGRKIVISDVKDSIQLTGKLYRAKYTYDGALSATVTLYRLA